MCDEKSHLLSLISKIEQAKVKSARDQVNIVSQAAASANKQVKRLENEIDELRREHRKTPEVELMHQIAR